MSSSILSSSSHLYQTDHRLRPSSALGRAHQNHRCGLRVLPGKRKSSVRVLSYADDTGNKSNDQQQQQPAPIQLYGQIERLITETARQSQGGWGSPGDWSEIEGAWVLKPRSIKPTSVVHFVGGIFVGAAPQLTYRLFLERLSERGVLVIATPFASGFDHFLIADEVQFKYDRCLRFLQDSVSDLPTFGVGHSLGSVIHLLIGSRYAVQRSGNVFMAFNNKEASIAIPLFSPVIVPMAQSFGPVLSQLVSSPQLRYGILLDALIGSTVWIGEVILLDTTFFTLVISHTHFYSLCRF